MPNKIANRVKMTVSGTPGTGTITLGSAVAGFQSFAGAGVSNSDTVPYVIEDGSSWELGVGTYTATGTSLSRSVTASSNSGNPINATSAAIVMISPLAADLQSGTAANNLVRLDGSSKLPAVDGSALTGVVASSMASSGLTGTLGVASGGTGLTSLTAGYIPYGNGTGAFSSNSGLFWDAVNSRLGVGTSGPIAKFHALSGSGATLAQVVVGYNGSANFYDADTHNFRNAGATGTVQIDSSQRISASAISLTSGTSPNYAGMVTAYGGSVNYYDANTQIWRDGSSSEGMRLTGSRLGIGTTSPTSATGFGSLCVNGSSGSFINLFAAGAWVGGMETDNGAVYVESIANIPLVLRTNGTERMRIVSDGNVGIGTSSPGGKLNVVGGRTYLTNSDQYALGVGYGANGGYFIGADATNTALLFSAGGGSERMRLDASGNLGLGVTPSAWTSPYYTALQIAGNGASISSYTASLTSGKTIQVNSNCYATYSAGTAWKYVGAGAASSYWQVDGSHQWFTAASGTAGSAISFTQAMTLTAGGSLMIGSTTDYGGTLQVYSGTAGTQCNYLWNAATSGTRYLEYFVVGSSRTYVGQITSDGTTTSFTSASDISLKENITNSDSALASILSLPVRQFDWKSDGSHADYGWIAQEVYDYAPEAIVRGELWSADYGRITPRLIKAFQELAAEVAMLKGQING